MEKFWNTIVAFFQQSGIAGFFHGYGLNLVMILVACVLLFLAIKKDFEPYLLLPIAFGMLLVNLPYVGQEIFHKGGTEYNYISLASEVGLTMDQAKYLISEIKPTSFQTFSTPTIFKDSLIRRQARISLTNSFVWKDFSGTLNLPAHRRAARATNVPSKGVGVPWRC